MNREQLAPQIVMPVLRKRLDSSGSPSDRHHIIVELNVRHPGNVNEARQRVRDLVAQVVGDDAPRALRRDAAYALHPFVFVELTAAEIAYLLELDGADAVARDGRAHAENAGDARGTERHIGPPAAQRSLRAIFKIWDSTTMKRLATVSIRTVKADAAQTSFMASGKGIVWAVLDSGIDGAHGHFIPYANLALDLPLQHKDFTPAADVNANTAATALTDAFGHGTHVAGIIAGGSATGARPVAAVQSVDQSGLGSEYHFHEVEGIRGMAPQCKLLSLRILDERGIGDVTAAIGALEYVMQLNAYGARNAVHGVNISAGYLPDVRWYGTGQTPLCRMVDRVVASGVPVVVAAGNTGYVVTQSLQADTVSQFEAAQLSSINDPGNALLALTVGSTHREKPHTYGVSYYSSKGPTADGRLKPDVVAPGEKIVSCAAGASKATVVSALAASIAASTAAAAGASAASGAPATPDATAASGASDFEYLEDTGTSMSAPHVSGVIAAFLSVRPEYIGLAAQIRDLVVSSAIDLKRDARTQGSGLVDLMRMLQSV